MAEMEAVARRDSVPIVHWETGRFLATLCRALDPNVLEVGTAIGYSTLHLAEQLASGRVSRSRSLGGVDRVGPRAQPGTAGFGELAGVGAADRRRRGFRRPTVI
jgi:hypothetical protein